MESTPINKLAVIKIMTYKSIILIFILLFSNCVCTTEYITHFDIEYFKEFRILARIQEGNYEQEPDRLVVSFNHCSFPGTKYYCENKKLISNSLKIISEMNETEIPLTNKYASVFNFSIKDFDKIWQNNDTLSLKIQFDVDSLGNILHHYYELKLNKNKSCEFSPRLH